MISKNHILLSIFIGVALNNPTTHAETHDYSPQEWRLNSVTCNGVIAAVPLFDDLTISINQLIKEYPNCGGGGNGDVCAELNLSIGHKSLLYGTFNNDVGGYRVKRNSDSTFSLETVGTGGGSSNCTGLWCPGGSISKILHWDSTSIVAIGSYGGFCPNYVSSIYSGFEDATLIFKKTEPSDVESYRNEVIPDKIHGTWVLKNIECKKDGSVIPLTFERTIRIDKTDWLYANFYISGKEHTAEYCKKEYCSEEYKAIFISGSKSGMFFKPINWIQSTEMDVRSPLMGEALRFIVDLQPNQLKFSEWNRACMKSSGAGDSIATYGRIN